MLDQQQKIKDVMTKKQRNRDDNLARLYQTQEQQLRIGLLNNKDDIILNKQVEEAEKKSLKIWHEQIQRREELKQQVDLSRHNLIQKRRQDHEHEKSQEREFAEYMKHRNYELDVQETQERKEQRLRDE